MDDAELCRRIAARFTYKGEKRLPLYDRLIGKCLPCIIVWGTVAFCIAILALQKRIY